MADLDAPFGFDARDVQRLSRVVRYVETQMRGGNGTQMGKRIASPYTAYVQMDGCMHHDKTDKTKAYRVMSNAGGTADTDVTVDKDFEFEIYPGTAKGIWFKGDVCKVEYIRQIWQPVAWGRQYFEAFMNADLAIDQQTTVTIAGETIPIKEGGFTGAVLQQIRKVGLILAHKNTTNDFRVEWRPLIQKCS